jgi:hypothetical protein
MKTKTTHTPGPWQFGGFGAIYGPGTTPNVLPNSLPTATHIATAEQGTGLTQVHSKEERRANCLLIAAAPDMYDALRWAHDGFIRALGDCGLTGKEIDGHATIVAMRAAISKADGK